MTSVIGEVLPLAIGVAVSPIPIIAAILMLLSPRAKSMSVAFLVGWIVGIVVAIVVFTLLSSVLPQGDTGARHGPQGDQDRLGWAALGGSRATVAWSAG